MSEEAVLWIIAIGVGIASFGAAGFLVAIAVEKWIEVIDDIKLNIKISKKIGEEDDN